MATPAIAPHKPMARARSLRSVKTLEISESVAGNVMAAPSPITARAAMSCAGLGGEAAGQAGGADHGQSGQQHALAAEPVGQAAEGEQQRGEDEVVGVDDPLQLGGGGMQLAHQGGKRHVHQGRVEVDEERREQQRDEDHGLGSHSFAFSPRSRQVLGNVTGSLFSGRRDHRHGRVPWPGPHRDLAGQAEGLHARQARAGPSAGEYGCASLSSPRSVAVPGSVYEPGLPRGLFCEERYEFPPARGVTQRCMPGGISLRGEPSHEGATGLPG